MMKNQSRSKEEGSQEDEGGYDSDIARQLQERHAKLVQGKRPNRNDELDENTGESFAFKLSFYYFKPLQYNMYIIQI